MTEREALAAAIDMAGASVCLAWSLGVDRRELAKWRRVPVEHVKRCAAITGIPPAALNNDWTQETLL